MPQKSQQANISSFFKPSQASQVPKRRASSPIDLTGDDDDVLEIISRPSKKSRLSPVNSSYIDLSAPNTATAEIKPRAHDATNGPSIIVKYNGQTGTSTRDARKKWALGSPASYGSTAEILKEEEEKAKLARRRAFVAKLSTQSSIRERRHRDLEGSGSGIDLPIYGEDDDIPEPLEGEEEDMDIDEEEGDSNHKAASSKKSKSKNPASSKSSKAKGKSKVEVGPSGQTYTPLEKQAGCSHLTLGNTLI